MLASGAFTILASTNFLAINNAQDRQHDNRQFIDNFDSGLCFWQFIDENIARVTAPLHYPNFSILQQGMIFCKAGLNAQSYTTLMTAISKVRERGRLPAILTQPETSEGLRGEWRDADTQWSIRREGVRVGGLSSCQNSGQMC
ncbi:hypothetical protein E2C01_052146 [Portunus trituberculatus]|uniref:Uncharacterized protein n=1 Tax=Portunus trituberculatus TaxID=210409 RepID=A0A5B7GDN5_PORTR|nr:hypothetical protein [Portunus trituberculatus]